MSITVPLDVLSEAYPALASVPRPLGIEIVRSSCAFSVAPREVLFDVGAPCGGFPLLLRGTLGVIRPLQNGQHVTLYQLGPGEVCALSVHALIGDTLLAGRAEALDEAAGVTLGPSIFHVLMDQHLPFRRFVLAESAARTIRLVALLEQVAAGRVDERLARLLVERGPVLETTHQALADELGTAREVVSRILERFETTGAVRLRRGRVEVIDRSRLGRPDRGRTVLEDGRRLAG